MIIMNLKEAKGACRRCGTCCRKGGPGIHVEDKDLVERGAIPIRFLFTLRQGEPAYDNIKAQYAPLTTDLIKIKGQGRTAACIFFNRRQGCTIYTNRPLECRLLACWDTAAIEAGYNQSRLSRRDLLVHVQGLWELIQDHHDRCDYGTIQQLAYDIHCSQNSKGDQKLLEMIKFDASLRQLVVQKELAAAEVLDFFFGRPLVDTISLFGLRLNREGNAFDTCYTPYKTF